jgi:aminomethyltransferase
MTSAHSYQAVRNEIGYFDASADANILRISGGGAQEYLDRMLPGKVFYLQPYAALSTVVLDAAGKIIDLVQLMSFDDHYLLIGNASAKGALETFLCSASPIDVTVENVTESLATFQIEGPYSWRLAKKIVGPDVVGLRFLSFLEFEACSLNGACLRAGVSGEYGFKLIVPIAAAATLKAQITTDPGVVEVDRDTLKVLCRETRMPLFDVTVAQGDCPFDAGLRYMIDFRKEEYVHHRVLSSAVEHVETAQVGFIVAGEAAAALALGAGVLADGVVVGTITYLGYSQVLGQFFGYARLQREVAFPGIDSLAIAGNTSNVKLKTVSTPFFLSKSMNITME